MIGTLPFDPARLRADLPLLSRPINGKALVYLDSACTALKPEPVVRAMERFYLENGGCGGKRSSHLLSQAAEEKGRQARERVARFLGAETPNEIIFTGSTTDSMNLLARAFRLPEGKNEVVVTDLAHNSSFLPFLEAGKDRGYSVRVIHTKDGLVSAQDLERELTPKTALLVLCQASNVYGGVQPLPELVRLAHRKGVKVAVDAAQYVPTHREDVRASDVDFLAFSAHKLGGPFGVGVLYGKENLLNALGHYRVGGGTVRDVTLENEGWEAGYMDAPLRFEAGVQNVAGWVGLAAAIDYVEALPMEGLRSHVSALAAQAAKRLGAIPGVRVLGSPQGIAEGSLVSVAPEDPDFSIHDFNMYLNHELPGHVVALRVGEHCAHVLHKTLGLKATVRFSFHGHNTAEELSLAASALEDFMGMNR